MASICIPVLGLARNGGTRVLCRLASEWAKMGHEVTILCPKSVAAPGFPIDAEVKIIETDDSYFLKRLPQFFESKIPIAIKRVASLVRGINTSCSNADIVLANHCLTSWAVVFSKSRGKRFYYVQAYEVDYYPGNSLKQMVDRMVAYFSYHLPFVRIVNADVYCNYKNLKSQFVVSPGLDMSVFYPHTDFPRAFRTPVIIGCIGRKEPWKRTADVVAAVSVLRERGIKVDFRVAFGYEPSPTEPCTMFTTENPTDDNALADYYRSLDILIAPGTLQLGAPHYPILEGMACGTALVCAKYAGAENLKTALVISDNNAQEIADLVSRMLENHTLVDELRLNAVITSRKFDWKFVSKKFIDILERP